MTVEIYYLGPLVPNTWYEAHIQAVGTTIRIWMRERDSILKEKRAWAQALSITDTRSVLSSNTHFLLTVKHKDEDEREWSFDDISLVKSSVSQTPCVSGGGACP